MLRARLLADGVLDDPVDDSPPAKQLHGTCVHHMSSGMRIYALVFVEQDGSDAVAPQRQCRCHADRSGTHDDDRCFQ